MTVRSDLVRRFWLVPALAAGLALACTGGQQTVGTFNRDANHHYIAGDYGGFFRRDVKARVGGVAMVMAGPNGSVEMPVVYSAGTHVSRTPVPGPGIHAPATNGDKALGDCGRTAERPPAGRAPLTVDQLGRAPDERRDRTGGWRLARTAGRSSPGGRPAAPRRWGTGRDPDPARGARPGRAACP